MAYLDKTLDDFSFEECVEIFKLKMLVAILRERGLPVPGTTAITSFEDLTLLVKAIEEVLAVSSSH